MAARLPPTPSPSPPPPPAMTISPSATLPGRINTATRKQHTELNRLLIQRLPLALPPHTESPLLFSKGIVPFARIFILFEIEWELLTRHFHRDPTAFSGHEYDVRWWLAHLRPQGLARSPRLKEDLRHLRLVGGSSIYKTAELGDKWVSDMRDLMRRKPHILIAFAWVFYMALFSGGRWIRQQLANSGIGFWTQQHNQALHLEKGQQSPLLELPGISFLSFDGDQDGEDLKAIFKSRLTEAEALLTEQEKQDVIEVAQQLFDRSIGIVNDLDQMVYRQKMWSWLPTFAWMSLSLAAFLYLLFQLSKSL